MTASPVKTSSSEGTIKVFLQGSWRISEVLQLKDREALDKVHPADIVGIGGGMVVSRRLVGISYQGFVARLKDALTINSFGKVFTQLMLWLGEIWKVTGDE